MGLKMTTPKLRDGAEDLMFDKSYQLVKDARDLLARAELAKANFSTDEINRVAFITGARWALSNLHRLLEPINWGETHADAHKIVDSIIDKRVAIVEVEE